MIVTYLLMENHPWTVEIKKVERNKQKNTIEVLIHNFMGSRPFKYNYKSNLSKVNNVQINLSIFFYKSMSYLIYFDNWII